MLNKGTELVKKENQAIQEPAGQRGFRPTFSPLANVKETEREYVITLEMPGVAEGDVEVTVENNVLTVHGHAQQLVIDGARLTHREYDEGSYRRMFTLSPSVDTSRINAAMKDGVLTLTLAKAESARPRKIAVNVT